ncbi:MAG: DUF4190 domain-containing protein [Candidatus Acidiferrales bacterium]
MASAPASVPRATIVSTGAPTSGKALASMILGICSVFFSILTGLPAIILGHLAQTEIRKSGGRLQGAGMALAGLILGYLSAAFIPIVLIIAAIAIPNLLRAKMAANEASAVGSLRTIVTADITYSERSGHGFATSLRALGPPVGGIASENGAGSLDAALAVGRNHGYSFSYEASSSQTGAALDMFRVNADPITPGTTGVRHFYVDQTGVVRYQEDGPAGEHSPPIE